MGKRTGGYRHDGDLSGSQPVGLPTWNVTYNAQQSTIFMPCNYSGYFDPAFAASFGVADFDWSNAKQIWDNTQVRTMHAFPTMMTVIFSAHDM